MTRINLLPPEERAKAAAERSLLFLVLGVVGLLVVLGGLYMLQARSNADKQAEVDSIQAEADTVNAQLAALQPFATLSQERATMHELDLQLYQSRVDWSNILEEISLVIPETCSLTALTATVPMSMRPGAGGAESTATSVTADAVSLTGNSWTHVDTANFMTRLGLLPQLQTIDLVQAVEAPPAEGTKSTVAFSITAGLRPFATAPPAAAAAGEAPSSTGGGQ